MQSTLDAPRRSVIGIIGALLAILGLGYLTTPPPPTGPKDAIACPFLKMVMPDTTNLWRFASSCSANGLSYPLALIITMAIVFKQKGFIALIRQEAPDIYHLMDIKGVSHIDLYNAFIPQLKKMAQSQEQDGKLTLQDLVVMKEWVAQQVGVTPSLVSQFETIVLFIRAGGNLTDWTVNTQGVFTLLSGERPQNGGVVRLGNLLKTRRKCVWKTA